MVHPSSQIKIGQYMERAQAALLGANPGLTQPHTAGTGSKDALTQPDAAVAPSAATNTNAMRRCGVYAAA